MQAAPTELDLSAAGPMPHERAIDVVARRPAREFDKAKQLGQRFYKHIDVLARQPACGYDVSGPPSTEPTALAALVLLAHHRYEEAAVAIRWLQEVQGEAGSVGVRLGHDIPRWPTSLAVLAWQAAIRLLPDVDASVAKSRDRAVVSILAMAGEVAEQDKDCGHNTLLVGWPWVDGTHSWLEPTALHVMALKAVGQSEHPRTREGVKILLDRQLPQGGCNMGNTTVLGQVLRPQLQPTGLALVALAGEPASPRITKSLAYVQRELTRPTGALSQAWGTLGLLAHSPAADIESPELHRSLARQSIPHKVALLLLASMKHESPLLQLARGVWA